MNTWSQTFSDSPKFDPYKQFSFPEFSGVHVVESGALPSSEYSFEMFIVHHLLQGTRWVSGQGSGLAGWGSHDGPDGHQPCLWAFSSWRFPSWLLWQPAASDCIGGCLFLYLLPPGGHYIFIYNTILQSSLGLKCKAKDKANLKYKQFTWTLVNKKITEAF